MSCDQTDRSPTKVRHASRNAVLVPSTHPTHPAAHIILMTLKETQIRGYSDMQVKWSMKWLDGQGKRLVALNHAETVDLPVTGREFGEWVELILGTADVRWSRFHIAFLSYLFS